ncbi:MAG: Flp pilus assembly protein CpaB [Devosia nanyangense]|uniref:Flp pilus assembly protein CpaB n=1 Tax=Devosia nanyangense TaxID=1228055 RepID=A0A933NY02_9HYPH|nr:Flp pilus assembly protein CpaB [Devosia nanyangense]
MRVSRILLLLVALLAGGLAAYLATRGGGQPDNAPPTQVIQEARAQILVAKTPIGVGERLSDVNLQWQDWPEGALRPEYITAAATPEAITDMKGSVARFEIFTGEPIRQEKLVRSDQGYLSAVLAKGMRGVSIAVTAESASGGFIVPNDHVDVILARNTENGDISETILSNVRVLAINTRLGELGATGAPDDPNNPRAEVFADAAIATLELDPGQAETVANAGQMGKLSLSLRSIVDFAEEPGTSDTQRNAPIRLIRYGLEANVMAGTTSNAGAPSSTDLNGLAQPPVTVTTGVSPVAPLS